VTWDTRTRCHLLPPRRCFFASSGLSTSSLGFLVNPLGPPHRNPSTSFFWSYCHVSKLRFKFRTGKQT